LYFKQHKINYSVIYNPIEMNKAIDLDGQDVIEKWGEGGAKKILAIGRLSYEKNYPQLIIAFAQIVKKFNLKLMILGEGPERKSLEILIHQYNLQDKVLMPGFITNTSLFYQNADLYILSSRTEGFPNVLLEALSFGLKIISTNCPSGPSEILEGGKYGTLVPVNDNHALAIAIEKALVEDNHHNPEKIKERIEAFRLEKTISEYRQVLFEK